MAISAKSKISSRLKAFFVKRFTNVVGDDQRLPQTLSKGESVKEGQLPIQRRRFLGMGLFGIAGLALPAKANQTGSALKRLSAAGTEEETYWQRTDRFEEKMKLLQAAWQKKDYRLVRSLTDSLRISSVHAQATHEDPGSPVIESSRYGKTETLPAPWRKFAHGWQYYKVLTITETAGIERNAAPVEVLLAFEAPQVLSLQREIRVASLDGGVLHEVTSQVFGELRRGDEWFCKLLFLANCRAGQKQTFLVFYGNADAELPAYPTDLVTKGEGVGLDIENNYFRAILSKQTGQLERMILKREHGLELYSGGQGHGEPPGIDWAHDYVSADGFQKFRISLWEECPNYEVVRGPIATIVRRWGFPYSPVHPLFSPSRLNIDIEYRFYSGLPYFHKFGSMTAIKEFEATSVRDDEWVFTGQPFTEMMWMDSDGRLKVGAVDADSQNDLRAIGFFNKDTRDAFVGFFLEHTSDGLGEPVHSGSPQLYYKWHGQLWSRYPLPPNRVLPAGTALHQKNAYVSLAFTPEEGTEEIERLHRELQHPLTVAAGTLGKGTDAKDSKVRLARAGEAGDSSIPKKLLWEALADCKDPQLYKSDISIVDLGLVYDLRVRGSVVTVILAMPHRGRPLGSYFTHGSNAVHSTTSLTINDALKRVPGVEKVIMHQTWYPEWSANRLTDVGRKKLQL